MAGAVLRLVIVELRLGTVTLTAALSLKEERREGLRSSRRRGLRSADLITIRARSPRHSKSRQPPPQSLGDRSPGPAGISRGKELSSVRLVEKTNARLSIPQERVSHPAAVGLVRNAPRDLVADGLPTLAPLLRTSSGSIVTVLTGQCMRSSRRLPCAWRRFFRLPFIFSGGAPPSPGFVSSPATCASPAVTGSGGVAASPTPAGARPRQPGSRRRRARSRCPKGEVTRRAARAARERGRGHAPREGPLVHGLLDGSRFSTAGCPAPRPEAPTRAATTTAPMAPNTSRTGSSSRRS